MLFINSFGKFAFFHMQIDVWRKMIFFLKMKRVSLNRHFIAQDGMNCVLKLTKIVYGSVTCLRFFFSATIKFIYEFRGCRDHPRESTLWPLEQSWWRKKYQRCYPLVFQVTNWNIHPNLSYWNIQSNLSYWNFYSISTLPILLKKLSSRNFTVSSSKSYLPPSPIEALPIEKNLRTFFQ